MSQTIVKVSLQRAKFGSILVISKVVHFRCRCLTKALRNDGK